MPSTLSRHALRAAWPTVRQMGFRKFFLRFGLRGFALPVGLAVWAITWVVIPVLFVPESPPDLSYFGSRRFWLASLASVVLWPVGGWALAKWEWNRNERRFNSA